MSPGYDNTTTKLNARAVNPPGQRQTAAKGGGKPGVGTRQAMGHGLRCKLPGVRTKLPGTKYRGK